MSSDLGWQSMSPLEQVMLEPYTPDKPDIITVIFSLSESVNIPFIRETILPRLLLHPRFSSTLTRTHGGTFRYAPIPNLTPVSPQLDPHLVEEAPILPDHPQESRHRAFTTRLSQLVSTPLDTARPLWRVHLFRDFAVRAAAPCSTVVLRVHHSLSDGIGLLKYFLAHIADLDANHEPAQLLIATRRSKPQSPDKLEPRRGVLQWLSETAGDIVHIFYKSVFSSEPSSVLTRASVTDTNVCALRAPEHVTVATLKKASVGLGITINDLLFAACAGAMRSYVKDAGDDPDALRKLRIAMPFNKHVFDSFEMSDVSNQLVMLPVYFPVCVEDRVERVEQCKDYMCRLKRGYQPVMAMTAMHAIVAFPAALRRKLWHRLATKASALFSNVPGPRERLKIGGVDVPSVFFLPPPDFHVAVDVGIFSYAGNIFMGAAGDASRLKDPEKFLDLMVKEIDLISELSEKMEDAESTNR